MDAMNFDKLMVSFAQQNEIEELDFRDNKYHLVLDDTIELTCFQANELCYLHGLLDLLPKEPYNQQELLVNLLKTNLSLINDQRAHLCIEPDDKHLGLYLTRPLSGLDEAMLEDALVDYITCYERLKQEHSLSGGPLVLGPTILMP